MGRAHVSAERKEKKEDRDKFFKSRVKGFFKKGVQLHRITGAMVEVHVYYEGRTQSYTSANDVILDELAFSEPAKEMPIRTAKTTFVQEEKAGEAAVARTATTSPSAEGESLPRARTAGAEMYKLGRIIAKRDARG